MKKIGITQRVDHETTYQETRDGLDQRWIPLLEGVGIMPILIPNGLQDPVKFVTALNIEGVILSGGNTLVNYGQAPTISMERDRTESRLLDYAMSDRLPVLGICRGLQLIVHYFGGVLNAIKGHVASKHKVHLASEFGVSIPYHVNSYHNFSVSPENFPKELEALAWDDDQYIEMCRHRTHPIMAIMWHPERENSLTSLDEKIIREVFQ